MTEIAVRVQQQSDRITADGQPAVTLAGDRERALFTGDINSKYMQWLLAGKVFETHNLVIGTALTLEINAAYDPLEPYFRMTVPSSITMVPILFSVMTAAALSVFDFYTLTAHDTDTFSADGLAGASVQGLFIDNQGSGNPKSSVLTSVLNGDTAMTEGAATNLRLIHQEQIINVTDGFKGYNVLKGDAVAAIHGPASFLVTFQNAGAEELDYHLVWAELDKNYLVNN